MPAISKFRPLSNYTMSPSLQQEYCNYAGFWPLTLYLGEGSSKLHRWLKGASPADTMSSALFGAITNNPAEILAQKFAEWSKIWKCDDAVAGRRACRVIRVAMEAALNSDEAFDDHTGTEAIKAAYT